MVQSCLSAAGGGGMIGLLEVVRCKAWSGGIVTAENRKDKSARAAELDAPVRGADYRVASGAALELAALPTRAALAELGSRKLQRRLQTQVAHFADLQARLFAESRNALLVVFHGMDAAGKDSTIKHVTAGVNSQGFRVADFSKPSATELQHTWLHRHWLALPARGRIGIFNRSHYEEVVTVRVNPELLAARKLSPQDADDTFWAERLQDVVGFENHLTRNGMAVVKFFLNVSKQEQRRRLVKRLDDPARNWKYDPSDLAARRRWEEYQQAFETAIRATSTDAAPWYIVPADHKPSMRVIVASIIVETLTRIDPRFPRPDAKLLRDIDTARRTLGVSPDAS